MRLGSHGNWRTEFSGDTMAHWLSRSDPGPVASRSHVVREGSGSAYCALKVTLAHGKRQLER